MLNQTTSCWQQSQTWHTWALPDTAPYKKGDIQQTQCINGKDYSALYLCSAWNTASVSKTSQADLCKSKSAWSTLVPGHPGLHTETPSLQRYLRTTCNSGSTGSDMLFWLCGHGGTHGEVIHEGKTSIHTVMQQKHGSAASLGIFVYALPLGFFCTNNE